MKPELVPQGVPDRRRFVPWVDPRSIPVYFVLVIITSLYCIYVLEHLLITEKPKATSAWGWQGIGFHLLFLMVLYCFAQAALVLPGSIPNTEEWRVDTPPQDEGGLAASSKPKTVETKKDRNSRRKCKWCDKFKPDRCHHCRVCRTCVLRMDHHCPWIYNCVGFRNHKYFFLLLIYTVATLQWMTWTMWPTLSKNIESEVPFQSLFLTLFGTTLGGSMALLTTAFLCFHIYLMCGAMTTIEFCEKQGARGAKANPHYRGVYANICAVLGPNPLLWLLPFSMPSGDGLTF